MDEIFRRFFGFRGQNREPPFYSYSEDDDVIYDDDGFNDSVDTFINPDDDQNGQTPGCDRNEGFHFFFGNDNGSRGLDGMFEHFHRDMWRQMEYLYRQMDDMMKGFGNAQFPLDTLPLPKRKAGDPDTKEGQDYDKSGRSGILSPFFRSGERFKSPRDYMLKDDNDTPTLPVPVPEQKRSIFGDLFSIPGSRQKPGKTEDSDLDGKLSKDEVLGLLRKPRTDVEPVQPAVPGPQFFSSNSSVSITTIRGADGKVEHKKVMKDSTGREESTVTRSVGDRSHTVTTITGKDGHTETHESLKNMDEGELKQFDQKWNSSSSRAKSPVDDMVKPVPRIGANDTDLFSHLFGSMRK